MHGFYELMNRVRPQQEVNAIRDEIKVRKIERLGPNPSNVSSCQESQLLFMRKIGNESSICFVGEAVSIRTVLSI